MWGPKARQSFQQQGEIDVYSLSIPLLYPGYKEVNDEALPIILDVISHQSSQSGRPLKLTLGKPTPMQCSIKSLP